MFGKRFSRALAVTTVASLVMATAVFADNVANEITTADTSLTIVRGGAGASANWKVNGSGGDGQPGCNVEDGSAATMSFVGLPAGVTASPSQPVFTLCGNDGEKSVNFTASLAATAGDYSITVSIADSGVGTYNVAGGAFTLRIVNPPVVGDTTDPTGASISIDDGATWTNSVAVTVDLAANDNVGITKYRLAETQAGLDTAADVPVTPSTAFTASDVAFALTGADATAKAVWVRFFDAADNSSDASDTIGLDTVLPTISGSTGTYVPGTWTNQTVVVSFTCADNLGGSGIATDTVAGGSLTASGADQSVTSTGDCIDNAGNAATAAAVGNIDIDKIDPDVSVIGFTDGATYPLGSTLPTANCSTSDQATLSGVKTNAVLSGPSGTGPGNPNGVGTFTFTCSGAEDNAGNTADAVSATYTVTYAFDPLAGEGKILQPINADNSSLFSRGRAVPVKFKLAGDEPAGFVTSGWTLTRTQVSCANMDEELTTESVPSNTPSTVFRYDSAADQYIYNADFKDKTAGTCWRVKVTLDDGVTVMYSAYFKLQK